MKKLITLTTFLVAGFLSSQVIAAENRYQAHWNGKSYLILDSDDGHMWTYRKDSMIYNGKIDGDDFVPPEIPQLWQQRHGKWTKSN